MPRILDLAMGRGSERITGTVEKRSQVIENTLELGSFFMKLRRPEGVGDKPEVILTGA